MGLLYRVLSRNSSARQSALTAVSGSLDTRTVGKHGSIAVTERLIWTLKHEWLARVVLIRGLDHLGQLLADFQEYYDECRPHQRLSGATSATVYRGKIWRKPDRSAKQVTGPIRLRHFPEQRITVYELAA